MKSLQNVHYSLATEHSLRKFVMDLQDPTQVFLLPLDDCVQLFGLKKRAVFNVKQASVLEQHTQV